MNIVKHIAIVALVAGVATTAAAQTPAQTPAAMLPRAVLPVARAPEEVGLSAFQLKRLEDATKAHIESGIVPGAVMLVARRGKIAW